MKKIIESHSCVRWRAPLSARAGCSNRCPSPSGETPSSPEQLRSRAAGARAFTAASDARAQLISNVKKKKKKQWRFAEQDYGIRRDAVGSSTHYDAFRWCGRKEKKSAQATRHKMRLAERSNVILISIKTLDVCTRNTHHTFSVHHI